MGDQNEDIIRRIELLDLPHRVHCCIVVREERTLRYHEKWRAGTLSRGELLK